MSPNPSAQYRAYLEELKSTDLKLVAFDLDNFNEKITDAARWHGIPEAALEDMPVDKAVELADASPALYHALQYTLHKKPPPAKYHISLREVLAEFKEKKGSDYKPKSLADICRAVDYYLKSENLEDTPLQFIDRQSIYNWADNMYNQAMGHKIRTKYINFLGLLWKFAADRGLIDKVLDNPFTNVDHKRKHEKTQSYEIINDDDLMAICNTLGSTETLPIFIAYYTGMRLDEIFKLNPKEDIHKTDDVLCFHIREGKTAAAARIVPVHSAIIERVLNWSNGDTRLSKSSTSDAYSKKFGRAKRKVGITERHYAFHSLRTGFITTALNAQNSELIVGQLVGHSASGGLTESSRTYLRGFSTQNLKAVIESIPKFPF